MLAQVRVRALPGLVLFESGLTGMGYAKHTRSAIQIRTGPPTDPPRYPDLDSQQLRLATVESNHCNVTDRTVATFRWVRTRWPLLERYK